MEHKYDQQMIKHQYLMPRRIHRDQCGDHVFHHVRHPWSANLPSDDRRALLLLAPA